MIPSRRNNYKTMHIALFTLSLLLSYTAIKTEENVQIPAPTSLPKTIKNIVISGNKLVDTKAILNKIPYKKGEIFDPRKTRQLIHNLYYKLKRIKDVQVFAELTSADTMNLHVKIKEKKVLKEITFLPKRRSINDEELKKKINIQEIPALDEQELKRLEAEIKRIYASKSYHETVVSSELKIDTDGRAIALFHIKEGVKSRVKRVLFVGNKHASSKELRKLIFTREDWLLGFLDSAGTLQRDRLEADKHIIEQYYQSRGYMQAKVYKVDVDMNKETKHFNVTFHIQEGDIYTIKEVKASGNDILKDEYVTSRIPIKPGQLYSRKKIVDSIKALELVWGDLGYLFTHIEPSIQPNDDDKTVNISFFAELGEKIYLNKINIIGNRKTKDKVIRRKIILREGDLITNRRMDISKYNTESLGFFNRQDGVNWKTTRIDDTHADLDLVVKEERTGHAGIKLGFGGSVQSLTAANSGFSVSGELNDTNLFGTGISLSLNTTFAKGEKNIVFNITDPWLFDMPLTGAIDVYHRRPSYGEFRNVRTVYEKQTGGGVLLGFVSPRLYNTNVMFRLGADRVLYEQRPQITFLPQEKRDFTDCYQQILDKLFDGGSYFWFETNLGQDRKNHPIHASMGYKWILKTKFGMPSFNCNLGYFKLDFDYNWYTPLIGQHDLILRFHTYLGYIKRFKNRTVPYRELFHIGGPASVRGFLFGQIGPQFCGDSIGGTKTLFTNVELLFPVTEDFNLTGLVFYDGGAGWDYPYPSICPNQIEHNNFHYRHAVGFGFRMMNPVPVRIDLGFKLDRRKKWNETPYEVHFGMTYDW